MPRANPNALEPAFLEEFGPPLTARRRPEFSGEPPLRSEGESSFSARKLRFHGTGRANPARTPAASELVRYAWAGRVEAEYRSAAVTAETVLWLIQAGASPDLARLGLRIVDDELVHAELSRRVWQRAGGEEQAPLDRDTLALRRTDRPLELDLVEAVVSVFCLGETVAVKLFGRLRQDATVPIARRAFDRILRDEVRHRDFGWLALSWMLTLPRAEELRAVIERGLPRWLNDLEHCYGDGLERGIQSVSADERAWGVVPWAEYREILHRAFAREYPKRFARLGLSFPGTTVRAR